MNGIDLDDLAQMFGDFALMFNELVSRFERFGVDANDLVLSATQWGFPIHAEV